LDTLRRCKVSEKYKIKNIEKNRIKHHHGESKNRLISAVTEKKITQRFKPEKSGLNAC
jgi:hypothetical protein